jgi:hypothetical protein
MGTIVLRVVLGLAAGQEHSDLIAAQARHRVLAAHPLL